MERYFNDRWSYVMEPCEVRLLSHNKIIYGELDPNELLPLRGTSPPSAEEIDEELSRFIVEW